MVKRTERSKKLIKYGFIKEEAKSKYEWNEDRDIYEPKEGDYDPEDAHEEIHEQAKVMPAFFGGEQDYVGSGYPDTPKKYRITYKSPSASLEESYYWLLDYFKMDVGFPEFKKFVDVFSASEQSAFWGQAQQRMGLQQDRVSQYMQTIGKMVKDLFQLVRELRILEERLTIYKKAPKSKSADVTLKGLYIDMVEGGSKNPSSVYGIAQQVGFSSLPDLFFNTHIYDQDNIDEKIEKMDFNESVKNVLRRKLYSFVNWKEKTESELKSKFKFTLQYLRQHWHTIKMYMNWIKPYLRNVERLKMSQEHMESQELIGAFESSMTEIEVLATRPANDKGIHPCILLSMRYVTQPEMDYQQERYQHRGPLHIGEVQFHMRAYGWTDQDIENFRRMKREEDLELLKLIDESVEAAMTSLGDELMEYLEEAGAKLEKFGIERDEEEEAQSKKERAKQFTGSVFDPFVSVFKGLSELFGAFFNFNISSGGEEREEPSNEEKMETAEEMLQPMYLTYKNYKKAHGMIHW